MTIRKVLQLLGCSVMLALPVGAGAQEIDTEARGKNVILLQDVELTRKQKRRLGQFQKKVSFYGALAVNLGDLSDDAFGAAWERNSLEAAKDYALRSCRNKASDPTQCVLLAAVVPGNKPPAPEAQMLSRSAIGGYEDMVKDREFHPDFHYALVTAPEGAWVWRESYLSAEAAIAQAMERCEYLVEKAWRGKTKAVQDALRTPKYDTCSVRVTLSPQ